MKKTLTVLFVLLAVLGAAFANGEAEQTATTEEGKLSGNLEVGVMPAEGTVAYEFINKIGNEIIAKNPDLEIEYTFANTKARAFMEQRWRANDGPDIDYFVFNAQVPSTYEFTEKLLDLTPYIQADPEWSSRYIDAATAVTTLDGHQYGVVTDTHVLAIYYNKGYFDEFGIKVPETWTEFLDACETLKTNGIDPIAISGTTALYLPNFFDYLCIRLLGHDVAKEHVMNGTMSEKPEFLQAAKMLRELVDKGYILKGFEGTDFTGSQMMFFQGKAGMILVGTWLASEMAGSIPEDFQMGIFNFPAVEGGKGDPTEVFAHANIMAVNKDSDNLDAAIEFVNYFTSKEVQMRRTKETGLISAVKGVDAPSNVYGLSDLISNAGKLCVRYYGMEFTSNVQSAFDIEIQKLWFGEYTPEEFIKNADAVMAGFVK